MDAPVPIGCTYRFKLRSASIALPLTNSSVFEILRSFTNGEVYQDQNDNPPNDCGQQNMK